MGTRRRYFKIDGVTIPTPSTYNFNLEDLSSEQTGRTLDGVMHKDVVDDKMRFDCTWTRLSWEDASKLLSAVNKKTKVSFTHADPRYPPTSSNKTGFVTGDYYVGTRTGSALDLSDYKRNWVEISMDFIEI